MLQVSKSFISREANHDTKTTTLEATPDVLREKRLALLSRLLTEEKKLVRESDVYSGSTEHARRPNVSPNVSPKRHRTNDMMASPGSAKKRKAATGNLSEREFGKRKSSDSVSMRALNCSITLMLLSYQLVRPH